MSRLKTIWLHGWLAEMWHIPHDGNWYINILNGDLTEAYETTGHTLRGDAIDDAGAWASKYKEPDYHQWTRED